MKEVFLIFNLLNRLFIEEVFIQIGICNYTYKLAVFNDGILSLAIISNTVIKSSVISCRSILPP